MKVYFATDHAGFDLKNELLLFVGDELGYSIEDCGAFTHNEEDDYPDFIRSAAEKVAQDPEGAKAIVLGGSGQGEAMCANRIQGVRAAVYYGGNPEVLRLSREHNNANVLSLGVRFLGSDEAKTAVRNWLSAGFTAEERHVRRIAKLDQ